DAFDEQEKLLIQTFQDARKKLKEARLALKKDITGVSDISVEEQIQLLDEEQNNLKVIQDEFGGLFSDEQKNIEEELDDVDKKVDETDQIKEDKADNDEDEAIEEENEQENSEKVENEQKENDEAKEEKEDSNEAIEEENEQENSEKVESEREENGDEEIEKEGADTNGKSIPTDKTKIKVKTTISFSCKGFLT
ncbi:MAG: hypothetical protein JKX80_03050, partial [Candidatus Pacebacteria bacterium]|nr:hypothetical protein [Candidatus Paceibacterota bacterium]